MASSTAVCKSHPPKARKRIVVGIPGAMAPNLNKLQQGAAIASSCSADVGTRCDKDSAPVKMDMHDCVDESSKSLGVKPGAKDAAKAKPTEIDNKITRKRRGASDVTEMVSKPAVRAKKEKDPNEPKRPPTAFFLFMEEFRQTYKKANPNAKGGAAPVKEGSEKWRSMSDEAKEPYAKKCADMKEEYQKALKIYNSSGKDSIDSTITDNAEAKCDGADESCEETAASADHTSETEQ